VLQHKQRQPSWLVLVLGFAVSQQFASTAQWLVTSQGVMLDSWQQHAGVLMGCSWCCAAGWPACFADVSSPGWCAAPISQNVALAAFSCQCLCGAGMLCVCKAANTAAQVTL